MSLSCTKPRAAKYRQRRSSGMMAGLMNRLNDRADNPSTLLIQTIRGALDILKHSSKIYSTLHPLMHILVAVQLCAQRLYEKLTSG